MKVYEGRLIAAQGASAQLGRQLLSEYDAVWQEAPQPGIRDLAGWEERIRSQGREVHRYDVPDDVVINDRRSGSVYVSDSEVGVTALYVVRVEP